ncbi:MAG TPA: DNA-processing protein DprA [Actinomycetota bacterium]
MPGEAAATQERPRWPDGFVGGEEDRRALLVLSALQGITPRRLIEVAAVAGSAAATLAEVREGRAGSANDQRFARSIDPDRIAAAASACGARVVTWGSPEYPSALAHVHDPPSLLYVVGGGLPDPTRAVAVVGSRRCTGLGREIARSIGRGLSLAGLTVVSGAARGIDSAAHEGALDGAREGGDGTVAVLGCGIDVGYPSRRLLERICGDGALVSEFAPGTPPEPHRFPARNRIVAGLAGATVVVEGAEGSGSMITAEHAMEFGRDVFAVPGAVNNPLSSVPLQLIRDGATMIRGVEDLLLDLGAGLAPAPVEERADLSAAERAVLRELAGPTLPERVAGALGMRVPEVVAVLMGLELRGLVRSVGGRFESTLEAPR